MQHPHSPRRVRQGSQGTAPLLLPLAPGMKRMAGLASPGTISIVYEHSAMSIVHEYT
jgi:hypothetical protein